MIWLKFIVIQLVMLLATIVGWFLLIPFCLAQAWAVWRQASKPRQGRSIKDGRAIDMWTWEPLNPVYGNPEDGVSGQTALIWLNGDTQGPYMPGAWAPWRAYCWSAWRNSANNLKYVFADKSGSAPLITFSLFNRIAKIGWQGGIPVLSF